MYSRQLNDGLAELARANDRKRDAALLRATTELFALDVAHERDELRRYEELAVHFLPKVPAADRVFVAERLAICSDAPLAVIGMLARDVIEVAAPIISLSTVLQPIDFLSVIATTGVEHHRLIAQRSSLAPEVRRALRLTGDPQILSLLDEEGVSMRGIATDRAVDASSATVSSGTGRVEPRRHLDAWRFLDLDRAGRLAVIAEIAGRPPIRGYTDTGSRLDRAFRSILSAAQIVSFARSGQLAAIIAAIVDGLGLQKDLVAAAIDDPGGELLAVLLKALRLDEAQAAQVFLLASPTGRDVNAFFPLSDLYAGMEPSVAVTLIEGWRQPAVQPTAGHQPHLAENGDRRRTAVSETSQPARQQPTEQAKRA